jgi:hypothetical protein
LIDHEAEEKEVEEVEEVEEDEERSVYHLYKGSPPCAAPQCKNPETWTRAL